MGGIFQLFGGRGGDFQELGHCPLFGLLQCLETVMAPLGVSFSLLTEDQGLPSWTHLILIGLWFVMG